MLLSNNTHLDILITEVLLQLTIREGSRLFQLYFAANKETIENAWDAGYMQCSYSTQEQIICDVWK